MKPTILMDRTRFREGETQEMIYENMTATNLGFIRHVL